MTLYADIRVGCRVGEGRIPETEVSRKGTTNHPKVEKDKEVLGCLLPCHLLYVQPFSYVCGDISHKRLGCDAESDRTVMVFSVHIVHPLSHT